jgi:hypothetical protein
VTALYVLSSIGGATAFIAAVWTVIRTVTGQVSATEDNTRAVRELSDNLMGLKNTVNDQGRDIAWLKGRAGV